MELLENLGINGKIVLAQLINFFILFYVLKKFAYGPVLKILEERSTKIEKGLKDAQESSNKLVEMEAKEKEILVEAKKQAQEIIKKSQESATLQAQEIIATTKEQSQRMLETAQKQIEQEKTKILAEVKLEVASLVMLATEKIIDEKLDGVRDGEMIKRAIN